MSSQPYPKETAKVHKHFDIGVSETVITHFACAHKGRILKQGRLYITQNYLCFYAVIVGKVHKKTIKLVEIADVAKTNYGVFPNAIKITTQKKKEIVFASFLMRDQAYEAIRKEWLHLMGDDFQEKEEEKRGASPSPRRGSVDPSSESESESGSEKEGKKKRRFSLTKKDKKKKNSVDLSSQSDTEVGRSDVSSDEAKRRHSITTIFGRRNSTSSNSSSGDRNSGKFETPAPSSTSNNRPPSTNLSASSSSSSVSSVHSSAPSTPANATRGDRAEALIKTGAISVSHEPTPTPTSTINNNRQSLEIIADPTGPSDGHMAPPSLWHRLRVCYGCC